MARLASILVLLFAAVACSEEEQTDYTAVTENEFLAACTDPLNDSRLEAKLCECVFDRTQRTVDHDQFVAIDKRLTASERPTLPDEYASLVAECVIEEASL